MTKTINREVRIVDVFTAVPFQGNPVAVVLDADEIEPADMQSIANWTNLSETTFVCKATSPEADYRLRIFTPRQELPFAGHPTVGSARAVLDRGIKPRTPGQLVQECGGGNVRVRVNGEQLLFALPQPQFREVSGAQLSLLTRALGIERSDVVAASVIDVGPVWATVALRDANQVLALKPDMAALQAVCESDNITGTNIFGPTPAGSETQIEVRSFVPGEGVPEDPVCGSGNGCVAALIQREGLLTTKQYVASQGRCVGRNGRIAVSFGDDAIWVGGNAVTVVTGQIAVPLKH
jgi:PhzF family phenazine biosynthesis protein